MIIKPIETNAQLSDYFGARNLSDYKFAKDEIQNNAINKKMYELDTHDLFSFHFGAYDNNVLLGCARLANPEQTWNTQIDYDKPYYALIKKFVRVETRKSTLPLNDYVHSESQHELVDFFKSITKEKKTINEIGRLLKTDKNAPRDLMKYILCYAWAYDRYYKIDYCFFETAPKYYSFYNKAFNCKKVLSHIEFSPVENKESYILMQATTKNLPMKTDIIINQIVDKFIKAGGPCAINVNEISTSGIFNKSLK